MKQHEASDVNVRALVWIGVVFVVFAVILHGLVAWGFFFLKAYPFFPTQREVLRGALPPEPRLEVTEVGEFQRYQQKESEILNGYGWVDRKKGIARIPIQRAMEIYVGDPTSVHHWIGGRGSSQ